MQEPSWAAKQPTDRQLSSSSSSSAPACYGQRRGTVPTSQVRPRTTRCDAANGAGRPAGHSSVRSSYTQRQQSTGAAALGGWLRPPKRRTAARAGSAAPPRPAGRGGENLMTGEAVDGSEERTKQQLRHLGVAPARRLQQRRAAVVAPAHAARVDAGATLQPVRRQNTQLR
eukprot:COSAG01_NODE_930_length_12664_cov_2.440032_9_plen_171_part_00